MDNILPTCKVFLAPWITLWLWQINLLYVSCAKVAGVSVREVARQIGESHTNVSYWERSGQIPRSDVLAPLAKTLGVTVEELLGQPKPRRTANPGGKLGQVFPSGFQAAAAPAAESHDEMAEGFLALHRNSNGKAA